MDIHSQPHQPQPRSGTRARATRAGKRFVEKAILKLPPPQARWLLFTLLYRRFPNFREPKAFNEKVNWRLAYDRRPLLVVASSKVASKDLVRRLAPEIMVPRTLWHGEDLDELRSVVTDRRWVLKASHRSGCILAGNPSELDPDRLKAKTQGWLDEFEFKRYGLWAYSLVRREYILEDRIEDLDDFPVDYKFFVFAGRIGMIQVDVGRFGNFHRNLYTADWTPLLYTYTHPAGPLTPPPPNFAAMCAMAGKIGADFDFVRVDLYNVDGRIHFGELTVYPAGGSSHWPRELDIEIGSYWTLPSLPDAERRSVPLGSS